MGKTGLIICLLITSIAIDAASINEEWAGAPKTLVAAKYWREGDPVPSELRRYYHSTGDMPTPMDTESLFLGIKNDDLLATLALDVGADEQCREEALKQGIYHAGPKRFFNNLRMRLDRLPKATDPWHLEVLDRMTRRHVVVDALSIDDDDMSAPMISLVMTRIEKELRRGRQWEKAYRLYAYEHGYKTGHRTKIRNLGHFVVFPDPALGTAQYEQSPGMVSWHGADLPRRLTSLAYFESSHLPSLIDTHVHDVVRLRDEVHRSWVLYQVQEVYEVLR